jgi:hypothetical protein
MSRRNRHMQIRTCAFCVLVLLVLGCSTTRLQKLLDQLSGNYEQMLLNKYKNADLVPAADKAERNEVLNDLLLLIDHHYYCTEAGLYSRKAFVDFGSDVVITGLAAAGALTGDAGPKSVLVALQGTRTSFDKDNSIFLSISRPREFHDETLPQEGAKTAHFCSMCGLSSVA